jgi:hypothetical protein
MSAFEAEPPLASSSLRCELSARELLGLLNGLARLLFYGDREISRAFLREQLFASTPAEAALAQVPRARARLA